MHLSFGHSMIETGETGLVLGRIVDLGDGVTRTAWRLEVPADGRETTCLFFGGFNSALQLVTSRKRPSSSTFYRLQGYWDTDAARWIWQLPWTPTSAYDRACDRFHIDTGGGHRFYDCGQAILASVEPGSSEITEITRLASGSFVGIGSAGAGLAIWAENRAAAPFASLRAWAPDGAGVRSIGPSLPGQVCGLAVGADAAAGIYFEPGPVAACDARAGAHFFAAARADDGLEAGPSLGDEKVLIRDMATSGIFVAATIAHDRDFLPAGRYRHRIWLTRAGDWPLTEVNGTSDEVQILDMGLTGEHLYVVETPAGAGHGKVSSLRRYRLDSLLPQQGETETK
ncbi:hypothetical protein [Vulgatibacter sp.]|uniref:hypothetical protein n=1 Tax=Vulgatibacter sp. TaxID=1971226 RepID=UPI0035637937